MSRTFGLNHLILILGGLVALVSAPGHAAVPAQWNGQAFEATIAPAPDSPGAEWHSQAVWLPSGVTGVRVSDPVLVRDDEEQPLGADAVLVSPVMVMRGQSLVTLSVASELLPSAEDRVLLTLVPTWKPGHGEPGPVTMSATNPRSCRASYLVIAVDDFVSALDDLIDWKTRAGFKVTVETLGSIGATRDEILAAITEAYETFDPPVEYVLLVGDVEDLPTWDINSNVSDHPYACVDGEDFLPDVYVGRLTAKTQEEVATQVAKIVGYESTPYIDPDQDWFSRALLVAGDSGSTTPRSTSRWIGDELLEIGYTETWEVFYPPIYEGAPFIRGYVDWGVSIVSYRGWAHGDLGWDPPVFLSEDVPTLSNGWKLPVVFSIVCHTNNYGNREIDCFGEVWMKTGSAAEPRGAIGFIGTGEHWSHSRWNDRMAIGIFEAFCHSGERELGKLLAATKLGLMDQFPTEIYMWTQGGAFDDETVEYYAHIYNLLGDPSLTVWTAEPDSLDITAPAAVAVGANVIEVAVARKTGGAPIAEARVALSANGAPIGYALTGEDGIAQVPIVGDAGSEITLTVTGTNLYPWSGTLPVSTSASFLAFQSATIEGRAELLPGASANLDLELLNTGTAELINVTGILTGPAGVTITTATADFSNVASGGNATSSTPFVLTVDPEIDHEAELRFELTTYASGEEVSTSEIWLPVAAPEFTCVGIAGADADIFMPGEEIELYLTLRNDGIAAGALEASLSSMLPDSVVVTTAASSFEEIAGGETGRNTTAFVLDIADHIPVGQIVPMVLTVTSADGPVDRVSFNLVIGEVDFSAPIGPDTYGYYVYDSADIDYRGQAPIYEWIECSPLYGGSGTHLDAIRDNYAHQVVSLPFEFQYYGVTYNEIDVCDNGWIAFDTEFWYDIRNWNMPDKWGGHSQVAVFWDNLVPRYDEAVLMSEGVDGVYIYHDEERGAFVIEWSHLINWEDATDDYQTFEILLMDPSRHPTATGDGEIIFQYKQIVNDDVEVMYSTVGIEDQTEEDGILYTYGNLYADGAAPLSPGLAIKFTTEKPYYEAIELDAFAAYWTRGTGMDAGAASSDMGLLVHWELTDERPLVGLTLTRAAQQGDGTWDAPLAVHTDLLPATTGSLVDEGAVPGITYRYTMTGRDRYGKTRTLGEYVFSGEATGPVTLKLAHGNLTHDGATILYNAGKGTLQSLAVYDLAGRRICDLTAEARGQVGPSSITWNGRDDRGARVSGGVYWVRLATDDEDRMTKLVMIR